MTDGDANEHVIGRFLRVFDEDVEVAVFVEHAGIEDFKFRIAPGAAAIFGNQPFVRKRRLRIFVKRLHVRMRGRGIEIEILLFYVLAVITLGAGEAEEPLLENGVASVPKRQGETDAAFAVGNAQEPVLAPSICPAARLIVRKIIPAIAIGRIILAHRGPLPLREIGPPPFPICLAIAIILEAVAFGVGG